MDSFHVACFIAENGRVIFQYAGGDMKILPLPMLSQLYGLYVFAKEQTYTLTSASSVFNKKKVIWKMYHDRIILSLITSCHGWNEMQISQKLDRIFQAIVFNVGLSCMTDTSSEDKFVREAKMSFPLIKLLMRPSGDLFCDCTGSVDVFVGIEMSSLQTYLENFASVVSTPYACVSVHGRMAIWTKDWFDLDNSELILLNILLGQVSQNCCCETPIFLPVTKPTEFYRLSIFQLIDGVSLCIITSDQPTFTSLLTEVERFWPSATATLKILASSYPYNEPPGIILERNILGFLLINTVSKRSLSSVSTHIDTKKPMKGLVMDTTQRYQILSSFFNYCSDMMQKKHSLAEQRTQQQNVSSLLHQSLETYLCCDSYQCYALSRDNYLLLLLFNSSIPQYALRSITENTMDLLTKDKNLRKQLQ